MTNAMRQAGYRRVCSLGNLQPRFLWVTPKETHLRIWAAGRFDTGEAHRVDGHILADDRSEQCELVLNVARSCGAPIGLLAIAFLRALFRRTPQHGHRQSLRNK